MQPQTTNDMPALRVESPAFGMNSSIPQQFTSDGDDVAPALSWSQPPAGTKSVAILVDDPDAPDPAAPKTTFTHWIVTGIRPNVTSLLGGDRLPDPAVAGTNDWGNRKWQGPNPPVGRHRYFFKVYALDIELDAPGITRDELLGTMNGHILAQGELIGTYEKPHERRSAAKAAERRSPSHR